MTEKELKNKIRRGETSRVQFKQQFTTQKEIAAEMVAFANCEGGDLLFGVKDKTGEILGLDYDAIQQTSRELGNTANEHPDRRCGRRWKNDSGGNRAKRT